MIEEASRESSGSPSDGSPPNQEKRCFLDDLQTENSHINEYEQMVSNVGPHGTQNIAATNDTADTVLYGNWEQDNNMQELDRTSSPDTVVRFDYYGFYDEDDTADTESSSRSLHQETSSDISKAEALPATKDWSIFQSNLVDYGPDEPSPRLPGCSAGHPYTKMWKMSDSAMIAYGAMRGSMMQTSDPLRSWMEVKAYETAIRALHTDGTAAASSDRSSEQQNLSSPLSPEGKQKSIGVGSHGTSQFEPAVNETSSLANEATMASAHSTNDRWEMGGDYVDMLKEANMIAKEYAPAEIDRKSTYEVPRPRFLHISPKFEGFNFEDYLPPHVDVPEPSYKQLFDPNRDFVKEYDVSDNEGDPASGRISPCTFRLLAEGCAKQEPEANKAYMAHDTQRLRPPSPLDDSQRRLTIDRLAISFELQRDVNDGGWLTPCYSMRNWWFGLFDRMDPMAARRFRKIQFHEVHDPVAPLETATERSVPSTTSSERKHAYTDTEVLEALHAPGSRRVAGIAPHNAPLIISQRWQTVSRWKGQETELIRENDGMRCAIERAKIELCEIRLTVDHLLEKKAAEEVATRQRKHKRVLRQVSAHLHELRYEIQSKFDALKYSQVQNQSMKTELAMLQLQIKEECSRVDMSSPDEVRKAVSQHFRDKMAAMELADCF
ncbi:hypothetical protein LY78DRAFT_744415 [Colletotrichum sublineola]|nr:hypothetical protein LY78DRAFT_744415 [Colletotrichum sublineola]